MGEEGTELRLLHLEKKDEARDLKQDVMSEKIIKIEKLNIEQKVTLNAIMWTLKLIAGIFITFVLTNIMMYYNSK